jgi:hypothetical protein
MQAIQASASAPFKGDVYSNLNIVNSAVEGVIVFDGGVTKNQGLFVAWRYVAAVPRPPGIFLQAWLRSYKRD